MKNEVTPQAEPGNFVLGMLAVRPSVMSAVSKTEVDNLLERHISGDWGLVGPVGQRLNDRALENGEKIFSVFESKSRHLLLFVTNGDRDTTFVALKDDPIWEVLLDNNRPSMATH